MPFSAASRSLPPSAHVDYNEELLERGLRVNSSLSAGESLLFRTPNLCVSCPVPGRGCAAAPLHGVLSRSFPLQRGLRRQVNSVLDVCGNVRGGVTRLFVLKQVSSVASSSRTKEVFGVVQGKKCVLCCALNLTDTSPSSSAECLDYPTGCM